MPKRHVPTVNLEQLTSADEQHDRAVETIGSGLTEFGFIVIEGHGVEPETIRAVHDVARAFFALPEPIKMLHSGVEGGARGYTAFGVEHARDHDQPDLKEFWQIGQELPDDHPYRSEYHANIWPDDVPGFRDATLTLFRSLERCAAVILEALARHLDLPPSTFVDMIVDGNHVLRLIHYPPLRGELRPGAVRAAAHEDINMITLLCEATESGLEILTRDGEWLPVQARADQIVVNAGDMLARVVNDVVPATKHRVVNPTAGRNRSRFSIPFFAHPFSACDLTVMERFTSPDRPAKYPPITAGEFLEERLREIGLKK